MEEELQNLLPPTPINTKTPWNELPFRQQANTAIGRLMTGNATINLNLAGLWTTAEEAADRFDRMIG